MMAMIQTTQMQIPGMFSVLLPLFWMPFHSCCSLDSIFESTCRYSARIWWHISCSLPQTSPRKLWNWLKSVKMLHTDTQDIYTQGYEERVGTITQGHKTLTAVNQQLNPFRVNWSHTWKRIIVNFFSLTFQLFQNIFHRNYLQNVNDNYEWMDHIQ